jgi:predicted O-methyltransferase YrrM
MGYRRIILAGCPLSGDAPAGNPYEEFRAGWIMRKGELIGTVRSLSGWTRDFLGAPMEAWLAPEWYDIQEPSRWQFLVRMAERYRWKRGAELGVWYGQTFFEMLHRCPDLNMTGVDDWRECRYAASHHQDQAVNKRTVYALLPPYANRATIIEKTTTEAARQVKDGSLDFVFIDADHDYGAVVCDIAAWIPKIRRGGFLAGHDYDWESVRCAVHDFLPDASVHEAGSDILWAWRRP